MSQNGTIRQIHEDDEISLQELLAMVLRHLGVCFFGFLLVVGLALGYLWYAVPQYESTASILVEPIKQSSSLDSFLTGSLGTMSKITTESELLTSDQNIQGALEKLDLAAYTTAKGIPYSDETLYGGRLAVERLGKKLSTTPVKDTNLVKITFRDASPAFAHDFLAALCVSYNEVLTSIARDSRTAQRTFIESQIPINDQRLQKATDELGRFRKESGSVQLADKTSFWVSESVYYQLKMEPLRLEIQEAEQGLQTYGDALPDEATVRQDETVQALLSRLADAQQEIAMYDAVSAISTNANTGIDKGNQQSLRMSDLNETILDLKRKLISRIATIAGGPQYTDYGQLLTTKMNAQTVLDVLSAREDVFRAELDTLPDIQSREAELERNVQVYQQVGLKLQDMLQETRLLEASINRNVTIIDAASTPVLPVSPQKLKILAIAILLGLVVGMALAILVDSRFDAVDTLDQLQKLTEGIPLLSWVPYYEGNPKAEVPSLIVENEPFSFESERIKLVANRLYKEGKSGIVYTVTSCTMSEGKTTLIANIALAMAQMGKRVLLVDGDLRAPNALRFFHIKNKGLKGLTDVVVQKEPLEKVILQPLASEPSLHLLASGTQPMVASAIFANINFVHTLDRLRGMYDYIFIDAPPLIHASELITLSKHTRGLIISVRASVAPRSGLKELVAMLQASDEPIVGTIFNGCGHLALASAGGNYSYSYSYGYSFDAKGKKRQKTRRHSFAWFRRRYKKELKSRGRQVANLKEPVLAYTQEMATETLEPKAMDRIEVVQSSLDALSLIEQNPDAAGKR